MAGLNGDEPPMIWDPEARRGEGGWVSQVDPPPDGLPGVFADSAPSAGDTNGGRRPPTRRLIQAGVVTLLAVAVGVTYLVSSESRSPSPEGGPSRSSPNRASQSPHSSQANPRKVAAALDALLERSTADRERVVDAVNDVSACETEYSVSQAQTALKTLADRRDNLVRELDGLNVDVLDGGAAAIAKLRAAWQHSADADRAFGDWAASAEGCTPGETPTNTYYEHGISNSRLATDAKRSFLALWNPLAVRYGLAARSETQI